MKISLLLAPVIKFYMVELFYKEMLRRLQEYYSLNQVISFCRKPHLTFDICATAVMGIKRLAIQLDPVETSSRCCDCILRLRGVLKWLGTEMTIPIEPNIPILELNYSFDSPMAHFYNLKWPSLGSNSLSVLVFRMKFRVRTKENRATSGTAIKAVIKRHSLLLKMVYVTQQVYFIVKAVVDLSKDVSTLLPHCVNRFQNHSLIMADPWLDRTNDGYTFQVKRSSSTPTSTISAVINLYVQLIQYTTFPEGETQEQNETFGDKEIQVWNSFPHHLVYCVPPSGMPFCNLVVDISYVIKLIIDPGFFYGNVVIRLNIVIASVRNWKWDEEHDRNPPPPTDPGISTCVTTTSTPNLIKPPARRRKVNMFSHIYLIAAEGRKEIFIFVVVVVVISIPHACLLLCCAFTSVPFSCQKTNQCQLARL
uniref:Uncharacterized protein n=1 Tax=Daphnia galeata TaxID=27404 RepID=A0A8J2RJR5_9CRUS|nr:unnamed protein product [Daphnia galeata]